MLKALGTRGARARVAGRARRRAAGPLVLLTGFRPFAGRAVNGSETLVRHLASRRGGLRLRTLILPVAWGSPAAKARPLIRRLRPALVLGLGEGDPAAVASETRAVNRQTGTDSRGVTLAGVAVDPAGPPVRRARLAVPRLPPAGAWPVTISTDAGQFLCNSALYVYAGTAARRVGFIHVPPQGERPAAAYVAALTPTILALIRHNLRAPRASRSRRA